MIYEPGVRVFRLREEGKRNKQSHPGKNSFPHYDSTGNFWHSLVFDVEMCFPNGMKHKVSILN